MTTNELTQIREFINRKSLLLMQHEKRTFAKTGFDFSHYKEKKFLERKFVIISTNVFHQILDGVLVEACKRYPQNFGEDDVNLVFEALYQIEKFGSVEEFQEFLKLENFAWILELQNGKVYPKVLRIELFRKIDQLKDDNSKTEFTGGIFHSFKHFTYNGIPLSTKRENKQIDHPMSIIDIVLLGFFFSDLTPKPSDKFESNIELEDEKKMCFAFYHEPKTDIYFLNSVIYK
jgi:hypothetical protein